MNQNLKYRQQNVFDFVLTNYGNLSYLSQFLTDNSMTSILDFGNDDIGTKYIFGVKNSQVIQYYTKDNYIVATGENPPTPDFNFDFNFDFYA